MKIMKCVKINTPIKVNITELKRIIATREPQGLFYARENKVYIGVDNKTGQAWTEEFKSLKKCKLWLLNDSLWVEDMQKRCKSEKSTT